MGILKRSGIRNMRNFFNKTSFGFIFRFALIISVSFAVLFGVNFYLVNTSDTQTAKTPSVIGN